MALALRSTASFADPLAGLPAALTGSAPSGHLAAVPVPAECPVGRPEASPTPGASVHVLHAPVDAGPAAPLRLTRRGVVVLSVFVGMICAGLVAAAAWSASATHSPMSPRPGAPSVVTVRAGDTLWSIAMRVAPDVDPRAEVAVLQRVNRLPGPQLVPGQRLRVG